ncbi:tigger transposable element-derived protein 4-like [Maniola hyperantus]|uniref:tigger transposable element-derived protein 4-like n=1 Tax=Aphantopus hyperantus TaxID=2795564 RepID=UPI00374A2A06
MTSKRKAFCVDEKVRLIRAIEKGEKKSAVGRRLGLSASTVATIWKNKEKILQAELEGKCPKKLRKPKFEDLDQAMLTWFNNQRQNNEPISGPNIKAQAEKLAEQLGITDFKASEGWLGKFKHRHNISFSKINEEARDVDINVTKDWVNKVWPKLRDSYAPNDIFNANETGIFFNMAPDQTLKFKGEKCVGGKLFKERITVLVVANMSGTEKRKLMVIGKSNLQCFKNIKQLPVTYKANKSAWMTAQFFEEEVRKWDAELKGRKILLLVDNSPAHPLILNLRNIELALFPANTTSVLQPMDQSVISSLKGIYTWKLLMELIESDGKTSINMLQAMNFISEAWKETTAATIRDSFRQAGFCHNDTVETEQCDSEEIGTVSDWVKQFNIPHHFNEHLQKYKDIDQDLATTASLTDEDVLSLESESKEKQNEDEEDDPLDDSEPPPTIQKALDAVKLLEKLFLFNEDDFTTCLKYLRKYWQSKK